MPMPPYLRFPENESFQQKFWGLRPRNPTCGKISLERGTMLYAWISIGMIGFVTFLAAMSLLLLIFSFPNHPSHNELIQGLKESGTNGQAADDWIEKLHIRQSHSMLVVVMFVGLIGGIIFLVAYCKLKKAAIERNLPELKKYFYIIVLLNIPGLIMFFIETEFLSPKWVLFDLPLTIFDICGIIFTYSFIVSLMNPDSQNEDLNRIQFSP